VVRLYCLRIALPLKDTVMAIDMACDAGAPKVDYHKQCLKILPLISLEKQVGNAKIAAKAEQISAIS